MTQRVFILEDQPDGVALLTQAVRESFSQAEITLAMDLATAQRLGRAAYDMARIDLRLPDGLSIDWLAGFKAAHPDTPCVVTSLYDDDELVFAALRAGADGYLLKGDGIDNLVHALAKVLQGEPPISPGIARKLMSQFRLGSAAASALTAPATFAPTPSAEPDVHLTAREQEVLALIGSGLMIKQVAARLNISYHTVNDNIKSIYRKLGIRTRAQAAFEASRRGLVQLA